MEKKLVRILIIIALALWCFDFIMTAIFSYTFGLDRVLAVSIIMSVVLFTTLVKRLRNFRIGL